MPFLAMLKRFIISILHQNGRLLSALGHGRAKIGILDTGLVLQPMGTPVVKCHGAVKLQDGLFPTGPELSYNRCEGFGNKVEGLPLFIDV